MPITPLVHITLPEDDNMDGNGEARHFAPIVLALDMMIRINEWHLRRWIRRAEKGECNWPPPLYASGVYYKEDPPGEENWGDIYYCLALGHADCDRLVSWRVAELRVAGIAAEPLIKWQQIPRDVAIELGYPGDMIPAGGLSMVHCLVGMPGWQSNGNIEDPSKILGMGGNFTSKV